MHTDDGGEVMSGRDSKESKLFCFHVLFHNSDVSKKLEWSSPREGNRQNVFSHWAECHLFLIRNLFSTDILFISETWAQSKTPELTVQTWYLSVFARPQTSSSALATCLSYITHHNSNLKWLPETKKKDMSESENRGRMLRETLCRREWRMRKLERYVIKVNHPAFFVVAHTFCLFLFQ